MQNDIYSANIENSSQSISYYQCLPSEGNANNFIVNSVHNTAEIDSISAVDRMASVRSVASMTHTQHVPFRLTLGEIIGNTDGEDPYKSFVLNPYNRAKVEGLYVAIACKDLPFYFRELQLDWRSAQIKNILGMICRDILPEDKRRFDKICLGLKNAPNDRYQQMTFTSDISFLLHKYGKQALYRHVEYYTECCRKSWCHHNQGRIRNAADSDIFTADAEKYYKNLFRPIRDLTKPKQEWTEIITNSLCFKDCCSGLASTIKINSTEMSSVLPVSETFRDVFFNADNDFKSVPKIGRAKAVDESGIISFLHCLVNVFSMVCKNK